MTSKFGFLKTNSGEAFFPSPKGLMDFSLKHGCSFFVSHEEMRVICGEEDLDTVNPVLFHRRDEFVECFLCGEELGFICALCKEFNVFLNFEHEDSFPWDIEEEFWMNGIRVHVEGKPNSPEDYWFVIMGKESLMGVLK